MIDPIAAVSSSSAAAASDAFARAEGVTGGDDFAGVLERVDAPADGAPATCTCGKGCASGWVVMDDASYFGAETVAPAALRVSDTADRLLDRRIEAPGSSITDSLRRSFASNARVGVLDALLDAAG